MKKATIEIPDGYMLVKVSDTGYKVVKNENKLPNTWEEFCKMNPIKSGEAYVSANGNIIVIDGPIIKNPIRDPELFCNFLPSKEKAESILALCQLIQLRDCYNDGWVPDWSNKEGKDCLYLENGEWKFSLNSNYEHIFAFKSPVLCRKFHINFRDLLNKIKPLYK